MTNAKDDPRADAILRRKANGLLAPDEAITELADADCTAALAMVVAERTRLAPAMVLRALEDESDEAISVMCRAAGLRINGYSALLRMRRRRNRGLDSAPTHALTFFSDLSPVAAKQILARMVAQQGKRPAR